jgi:hypothetical protein
MPERLIMSCSGNIVKKREGREGSQHGRSQGIEAAGLAGIIAGILRGASVLET